MAEQRIQLDERLNEQASLQLAADLAIAGIEDDLVLDFSRTRHFEPFGMLVVSSAVNRVRRHLENAGRQLRIPTHGIDPEGIAAHMGFWRSMNVEVGRQVGAEARKSSYLPITRIGVDEIYAASGGSNPTAAGVVEQRARELATVLAQPPSPSLLEALTYSLRELIRNVIEHARTPAIWVAGMSWPRRNLVQVAVLDEGRGIRNSLADAETFRFASDIEAIRAAVKPGVSRNLNRTPSPEQLERWADERHVLPASVFANAGYGLHMISSVCREAGQFLLASGSAYLAYVGSAEVTGATAHHGTALRLVLHPSEVPNAWESLFAGETARGHAGQKPLLSASTLRRLGLDSLVGAQADATKQDDHT